MENCTDLFLLSAIACKIAECLTEEELALVAANFTALGDMLQVLIARRAMCKKE